MSGSERSLWDRTVAIQDRAVLYRARTGQKAMKNSLVVGEKALVIGGAVWLGVNAVTGPKPEWLSCLARQVSGEDLYFR